MLHSVLGHSDGDCIRNQVSGVHVGFGLTAELRTLADICPEQITRGDMRDAIDIGEERGLRTLAGTWWSDEDDSHQRETLRSCLGLPPAAAQLVAPSLGERAL